MFELNDLNDRFRKIDLSEFPDFYLLKKPLEKGLWVLWVAKDKLNIKKLTAEQIVSVIIEVMEIRIDKVSIINSFKRAKDKVYSCKDNEKIYFEIMRPGKDYVKSLMPTKYTNVFYFEPGKPYSNKRLLSNEIFSKLTGEIKIVDPYCDIQTLDLLKDIKSDKIRILTVLGNLKDKRTRFLRHLNDFKKQFNNLELMDYSSGDMHDRYIIYQDGLVIIGQSLKDLGKKESFVVFLRKEPYRTIYEALNNNFEIKWNASITP